MSASSISVCNISEAASCVCVHIDPAEYFEQSVN